MTILSLTMAVTAIWVLIRLARKFTGPRRGSSPARELYERRLREGGWR